ncbi:MAG: uroporphyrinogen decarboxylase family protein [Bacteroidota bacterium]
MKQNKDLFSSAIRHEIPEPGSRVPIWELEFHGWNHFSRQALLVGTGFTALSRAEKAYALVQNAEVVAAVSEMLNFSAVTVPGAYWEIAPGHPAFFWLPEKERLEQIRLLQKTIGDKIMLVASNPAVLAMPGADEYMEFAYTLMERPHEIEARAKALCQSGMAEATRLLDLGVGALYTASDIADNHGPYFDPGQMEQLILPFLDRWATHVQSKGGLSILHSDGNLTPILAMIAGTSIQALQAIDPTAGMELRATKNRVEGQLTLCGNIECGLFITGSTEEVFEATRDALEGSKENGGLVLGASNAIEKMLKKENYLAFLDAWKTHGLYS